MPMPAGWKGSDGRARAEVALWLKMQGGEVFDEHGLIVGRMRTELGKGRALSQLLKDMEDDGMIKREVRGRRTLSIKLLDDWGLADDLSRQPVYRPPGAPQRPDSASMPADVDLQALAATLLARVIKLANTPSRDAEVEQLRQQVDELTVERDELRAQLLEARRAGTVPLRDLIDPADRALLDQLMQEAPSRK